MLNTVSIMGRFTRDPELRYTKNQNPVVSFTLAVDRNSKDQPTDFIDCVAWKSTAEFVSKYFSKGSLAAVAGRIQTRTFDDNEGKKRKAVEVIVDNIYFGESKKKSDDKPEAPFEAIEEEDGDLPF